MDKDLTCPVTAVSLGAALARHTVGTQCVGLERFSLHHTAELTEASSFTKVTSVLQVKSPQSICLPFCGVSACPRCQSPEFTSSQSAGTSSDLPDAPSGQKQQQQNHGTLKEESILHRSQSFSLFTPLFQCLRHLIIDSSSLMCQLGSGRASGKMSGSQGLSALCLGFYLHNFMWLEP